MADKNSDHMRAQSSPAWLRLEGRALYRMTDVLAYERARLRGPAG